MEFRILGNLEAETGGARLPVGGPHEQKVLAILLLNADHVVAVSRLVDALWDDDPPTSAVKQAQNAVGRLRRLLADSGETIPIVTESCGYRFRIDGHALDGRAFETAVAEAESAASAGDVATAATRLRSALSLWRGPALAGLSGRVVAAAADTWNERRCAVQETYHNHRLALGEHRQMIGDLRALVSSCPLRERPVAQLMLALYRCGRQAEALEEYTSLRRRLASDLGLDPGTDLQRLHQQILTRDPALESPEPARLAADIRNHATPRLAVPRQLPAAARNFVGRRAELASLTEALGEYGRTGVVSAIAGTAGVGKTALVVHWAHTVAERFPDGQLYVNLRGFDPSGIPIPPGEAVRGFLTALDVPAERMPATVDEQAALFRSLVADRKMLVVADNARDSAQVRPLLPGSPGCLVVVTSRSQLTGLVATHGAHVVNLDLLTGDEARQLIAHRIGGQRLADDPRSADDLIGLCARLPLALSITAARAAARPRLPLAALAAELRDTKDRLDVLDTDDTSVRVAFSWSYGQLTGPAARMFRLLGLHPGPDTSLAAAASLSALTCDGAARVLAELVRAHLVNEHAPGRFAFHDLLRAFAAEQARTGETEPGGNAAMHRLLDHYLHSAHNAAIYLFVTSVPPELPSPLPGATPETFATQADALAWLAAERRVLLAAASHAAAAGLDRHAWQIPWTMRIFLDWSGHWQDWLTAQRSAFAAAVRLGDTVAQAQISRDLGAALVRTGARDDARAYFERALSLFGEDGNVLDRASAYISLGGLYDAQGSFAQALVSARRALALYREADHKSGQAVAHSAIGWCLAQLGQHTEALASCEQSLALHRTLGNTNQQAHNLDSIGYVHGKLGDHKRALKHYAESLALFRQAGDRYHQTHVLTHIGEARERLGHRGAAWDAWQEALDILDRLGHPDADDMRGRLDRHRENAGHGAFQVLAPPSS